MGKRALIYVGVVLGGIGTVGEILMLIARANGGNLGVLIFWVIILAISLYFMQKTKKHRQADK